MKTMKRDPTLTLSAEEMRELGYRVVDRLVEHFTGLPEAPAIRVVGRRAAERALAEPPPEEGRDPREVLDRLERDVFAHTARTGHPRFFAFVPSPSNFVGVLGDALAAGFNPFAGSWLAGSGPSALELVTLEWLRRACDLPPAAGGLFTSGGSAANLIALHAARHDRLGDDFAGAVAYFSDQTHSSVERAFRILGFAPRQLSKLPSDDRFRLPVAALAEAVAADRRAGRRPFCVVANAGTTNTGAVDPLPELAELCRRQGLWLHADGAYGAAAVLTERGRAELAGLERVDSLSLDPHKWLFQPFEIGCVLLRDRRLLRAAFAIHPDYLQDLDLGIEEVNFCDYGLQLTRSFRALKLWLTFQIFGLEAVRGAIDRGFELAELAEEMLAASPVWTVETAARMGIVTFRYTPPGAGDLETLQRRLLAAAQEDGYAFLTSTRLDGRTVLRLCTINPRTTEEDLAATLARLEELGRRQRDIKMER